jgi:hypothetical protein
MLNPNSTATTVAGLAANAGMTDENGNVKAPIGLDEEAIRAGITEIVKDPIVM